MAWNTRDTGSKSDLSSELMTVGGVCSIWVVIYNYYKLETFTHLKAYFFIFNSVKWYSMYLDSSAKCDI